MKGIKIKIFRNHRAPLNSWAFPPEVTWMSRHFHGSKMFQVFQTKSSSQNMIQIMLGLARFSTSYPAAAAIRTRNARINDWSHLSHLRWSWYPSHGRSFPRRYSKFLLKMQHDAKRNHIPGEKRSILESALSSAIYINIYNFPACFYGGRHSSITLVLLLLKAPYIRKTWWTSTPRSAAKLPKGRSASALSPSCAPQGPQLMEKSGRMCQDPYHGGSNPSHMLFSTWTDHALEHGWTWFSRMNLD
jgi:hypothetical protein